MTESWAAAPGLSHLAGWLEHYGHAYDYSRRAGPARYTWRHAIAPRKSDPTPFGRAARGRRVSVTFRTVLPPDR